jgi:hypothetical protein
LPTFDLPALAAVVLMLGLGAGLWLGFRRSTRRTRQELERARADHGKAMAAFAAAAPERARAPGDGWAVVDAVEGGLTLRITAGADLKRTTFIRYNTTLEVEAGEGEYMLPPGVEGLDLDYNRPGPDLQQLAASGVSPELLEELVRVTSALRLERDRFHLIARPGTSSTHRYSYGLHLLLAPEDIQRLWDAGRRLGRHLLIEK